MADIGDGFYVTSLIGMGVNQVTGDYSRGASGFWIENGKPTYPVSEVTIAGNLIDMFASLTPANDLEFRTPSMRRPSVWRASPLQAGDRLHRTRSAGRGRARGRRARAQDLSQSDAAMDQGQIVAGLRGRHRGRRTAARAARRRVPGLRLAVGGNRGRPAAARGRRGLDRRSDRRHARLSRRPGGLGGLGRAGRPAAGRVLRRSLRR